MHPMAHRLMWRRFILFFVLNASMTDCMWRSLLFIAVTRGCATMDGPACPVLWMCAVRDVGTALCARDGPG